MDWGDVTTTLYFLGYLWGWFLIPVVLMQRKSAVALTAWILTLAFLPYLGPALYLWLGHGRLERRVVKRQRHTEEFSKEIQEIRERYEFHHLPTGPSPSSLTYEGIVRVTDALGTFAITRGNTVEIIPDQERIFAALTHAMENARSSIHLEYYIFQQDETGMFIGNLLKKAAHRGVECRLLIDSIGSWGLARPFYRDLRDAGVKVAWFLPLELPFPTRRWNWNLRNHRKIAVIDGELAFTGSGNIADEYRKRKKRLHRYFDTKLLIRGPAVHDLQEIFVEDWYFATKEDLSSPRYFPPIETVGEENLQIVPSGPDQEHPPLRDMICAAIHEARSSVHIISPYFIPDEPLRVALSTAALRGVEVIVLVSQKTDHPIVDAASRSYYEELLESGVRIFEFPQGLLHMKTVIMDRKWATTGSANLDPRSFSLNFEVNVNLYHPPTVEALEWIFHSLLQEADQIPLNEVRSKPFLTKLRENSARLLSPVL